MEHYVTLFNSLFLPQGLALYRSMERTMDSDFTLWVLCVDDAAHDTLQLVELPQMRLLRLADVENDALRATRAERSIAEYCWTLTPCSPRFVFESDLEVQRVTYVDADLWFRRHPRALFAELETAGKKVLITDHAYAPEYDNAAKYGQYCVQFMTFYRDGCETVRQWWEDRCMEWCYARCEDGRLGDQKYLDDWPERFPDEVHVLKDKELALAPWNATRFPHNKGVFWHFHGLRITVKGASSRVHFGQYVLPNTTKKNIYEPYLNDLREAVALMRVNGAELQSQKASDWRSDLRMRLAGLGHWLAQLNTGTRRKLF